MAFIGTAGWSIPAIHAQAFAGTGTHLERYGAVLNAVEINSSFYRPHRQKTYARWAASVPEDFRFSVKLPRTITHHQRLMDFDDALARFQEEVSGLGPKLGVILVQLPPGLAYDPDSAAVFFETLGQQKLAAVACEPRHPSWFTPEADAALATWRIAQGCERRGVVEDAPVFRLEFSCQRRKRGAGIVGIIDFGAAVQPPVA